MDKYRLLLSKQRDIMIALTARLNQRDEQILKLQEELEAYDSHQQCVSCLPICIFWDARPAGCLHMLQHCWPPRADIAVIWPMPKCWDS